MTIYCWFINVCRMRWTVHGIPRVPWDAEGIFDGISTFKVDSNGKIFEHAVNNVVLRDPPKLGNPFLAGLSLARLAGQQQQQPCPGAWFKTEAAVGKARIISHSLASTACQNSHDVFPKLLNISQVRLFMPKLHNRELFLYYRLWRWADTACKARSPLR